MPDTTPDEFERLTGNIHEELLVSNALQNLGLSKEQIAELAHWIAVNIDYAFEVRWAPRWEGAPRRESN